MFVFFLASGNTAFLTYLLAKEPYVTKMEMEELMKKITVLLMLIAVLAAPLMAAEDGPIGIITAMSNELSLLLENADVTETRTIGGVDYNIGTLEGQDVVLVKAGIGKIMAAAGAATLINEFDVSSIIFTGIAGGVGDETEVMDIVVSTDLAVHDYGDITNNGFEWDAVAGTDENGRIPADPDLAALAYDAAVKVVGEDSAFKGTIATGDQFVASESYVKVLQDRFNALACEMEGAAVGLVAYTYDVPFVVIRCMSDKADGLAHDTYENFGDTAADNSASIVMEMLGNM